MGALKYFSLFILALTFTSLFSLSGAVLHQHPREMQSVINATHAMSISGYTTMSAVTMMLYDHLLHWSKLNVTGFTIFAPTDTAFISDVSGKREIPPGETIFLHYSPVYLPLRALRFLIEISTISLQYNLITTSTFLDSKISISFVKISPPPIYDDGCVIVYSIGQLFNINLAKDKKAGHRNCSPNGTIPADPEL